MTRAVVFAYSQIGVRCLKVLLARGVEVALVVTHDDAPGETIWFDSVRRTAEEYGLEVVSPTDPNTTAMYERVRELRPTFLFSFYYRRMLAAGLLELASRGAWNLHGSLLPKYRGRAPVNWAVIHGEAETGASLHLMNEKPDNGAVLDQMAVPILPDDTAREVADKVCVAAELVLWRSLPGLLDGSARPVAQDLRQGAYFGGRRPEDGRIDPGWPAQRIHDFVRALSHPYPGAFAESEAGRLILWRSLRTGRGPSAPARAELHAEGDALYLVCADGGRLAILEATLGGEPLDARRLRAACGGRLRLPPLSSPTSSPIPSPSPPDRDRK